MILDIAGFGSRPRLKFFFFFAIRSLYFSIIRKTIEKLKKMTPQVPTRRSFLSEKSNMFVGAMLQVVCVHVEKKNTRTTIKPIRSSFPSEESEKNYILPSDYEGRSGWASTPSTDSLSGSNQIFEYIVIALIVIEYTSASG